MGALHAGHGALIDRARAETGCWSSVFRERAAIRRKEDYERYARTLPGDLEFCRERAADLVFRADADEVYPKPQRVYVDAPSLSEYLCGMYRPGHFRGVATVVASCLIWSSRPRLFWRKGAQQLAIVEAARRPT